MEDTENKKYEVWTGRWDEPLTKYTSFDAKSDEEALEKFKEYEKEESLQWAQVTLFPITIEMKPTEVRGNALKTVRQPSDDNVLDYVA